MNVPHAQIARVFLSIFCSALSVELSLLHAAGVPLPVFSSLHLDVVDQWLPSGATPTSEYGGFGVSSYVLPWQYHCCCSSLNPSLSVGTSRFGNSDYSTPRWAPIVPVWILGTE